MQLSFENLIRFFGSYIFNLAYLISCIIHNYTNSNIIPLGYGINLSLLWQIKTSHTIHGYF